MASTSRWLVGSSSSNTCGSAASARASKARLRQPPERSARGTSPSNSRRSSTSAIRISICQSSSAPGSAASSPSRTTSATGRVSSVSASCCNKATRLPGERQACPLSSSCSPANTRSSELFPSPVRPSKHTRSPAATSSMAWSSSGRRPKARQASLSRSRVMLGSRDEVFAQPHARCGNDSGGYARSGKLRGVRVCRKPRNRKK